jgi:hypothetical protein
MIGLMRMGGVFYLIRRKRLFFKKNLVTRFVRLVKRSHQQMQVGRQTPANCDFRGERAFQQTNIVSSKGANGRNM